tara:strand:- start:11331 stop:12377 length:1047 start_codon:yes stop_codon:yes gene_type:complete
MSILDEIRKDYEALVNLPPSADGNEKRARGFAFERLLKKLFSHDKLEPRAGYKPSGEQIDGSIYLDGRVYLLEAKWHADPLPASTLYQFKGKVDGKLLGTVGIFISMSGYGDDAVDALTLGKGLNVILVDRSDMDSAIIRQNGIKQILLLKIRKAAEEGVIYFPVEGDLVTANETRTVEIEDLRFDPVTGSVMAMRPVPQVSADLLIVCEGNNDRAAIAVLAERILAAAGSSRSIKILTAMGKLTIPKVANALWNTFSTDSKVLIVTDGDRDPDGTAAMLERGLEFSEWEAVIPNPSIETWLGLEAQLARRPRPSLDSFRIAAEALDIEDLRIVDAEFARFYDTVLGS